MTTLRIFGPQLESQATYIDATIEEITLDETVHLRNVNGNETWTLPLDTVNELREKHLAVQHTSLSHPKHNVWDRLDGVRGDIHSEPFTNSDIQLDSKLQEIFVTVMEVMVTDDTTTL